MATATVTASAIAVIGLADSVLKDIEELREARREAIISRRIASSARRRDWLFRKKPSLTRDEVLNGKDYASELYFADISCGDQYRKVGWIKAAAKLSTDGSIVLSASDCRILGVL